jgi:PAS domain S-box-containing protein
MTMEGRRTSLGGWLASLFAGSRLSHPPADFASALVESLADGVVACDADGNIVLLNRRARTGSEGFPAEVVIPPTLTPDQWAEQFQLYPPGQPELLPTDELPLMRALRGETVRDMLLETRGENGSRAMVNVSASPVRGEDGNILGAVAVMQDYTVRAANDSRRELDGAVAEHIALGVSMVSAKDGTIVYANEQWERLFGYQPGELVGKHISVVNAPTVVSPEDHAQEIFGALDRDGVWGGEFHNVRKDGTLLWTYANISRFEHPEHGTVWITASRDVTRAKSDDTALHNTAERLGAVFEDAPVGIVLIGHDQHVIDANRLLCQMVGWRRDELVGQPLGAILHPEDHALESDLAARVFNGEIPRYRVPMRYVTKRGDALPVTIASTVLRAPDGRPLYTAAFVSPDQDDAWNGGGREGLG